MVRHQHRVDEPAAAAEVTPPQAFALEAELLVQLDRRLVVREYVQLELLDLTFPCPFDRLLEQRSADPPAPVAGGDH